MLTENIFWHDQFSELVRSERKVMAQVLSSLCEIDRHKGYLKLGYSSLFNYLVEGQKYSEGAAQRRISAARLMREVPELSAKLQMGQINLTQIAQMQMAVKAEQKITFQKVSLWKKKNILKKLENQNGFETSRILAQELVLPEPAEKIQCLRDESVLVSFKFSKGQYEKLKEAQNLLSHAKHDSGLVDVIEILCDRLIKTKRGPSRATAVTAVKPAIAVEKMKLSSNPRRQVLPAKVQREVFKKAQHQCEYTRAEGGQRCSAKYQLQIDHRRPLAVGGSNSMDNLRVLCRSHNLSEAARWGLSRSRTG